MLDNQNFSEKIKNITKPLLENVMASSLGGIAAFSAALWLLPPGCLAYLFSAAAAAGVAGAYLGSFVAKLVDNRKGQNADNITAEDQIIAFITRASEIKNDTLPIEDASSLIADSEAYWTGKKSWWQEKCQEMKIYSPLNACPDDDLTPILVVYDIRGPYKNVPFDKWKMIDFIEEYASHTSGENGRLYPKPILRNIMDHGFKNE